MYSEVAWVLVSLGTQVQPKIILEPDHLLDYLSAFYDYGKREDRGPISVKFLCSLIDLASI